MFKLDSANNMLDYDSSFFTGTAEELYKSIEWEKRDVEIKDSKGKVIFSQKDVLAPKAWSQNAVTIAASKYFRGHGTNRESSIWDLCHRVAYNITIAGVEHNYYSLPVSSRAYVDLMYVLLHQIAAFNSPVWFNVGTKKDPQCSACFILDVQDTMESILNWYTEEGMVFKGGSGAGINLSKLREKNAKLSIGGYASGPMSFALTADRSAGAIKSGGTTRRAAKLLCMNADHPDIEEFIGLKVEGEKVAKALIAQGFSAEFNVEGGAYELAPWQNANNSVRVSDAFLKAVESDGDWNLLARKTGEVMKTIKARELWHKMATAAWECGDPGLQYDDTINNANTAANVARIEAANPCIEYNFLNNTACNLASINLMKVGAELTHVVNLLAVLMDVIVEMSGYPTETITREAKKYRTLGLGFANLGALLMNNGMPYDSDEGRKIAADIMSYITAGTYQASHMVAAIKGSYENFDVVAFGKVLQQHARAAYKLESYQAWEALSDAFQANPRMRNAQATVLAPTGTIGLLMDCDTTGIEPDIALVKYKKLVGGGNMKFVNQTVRTALENLGYSPDQVNDIISYVAEQDTIEGSKIIPQHLPIFDCALQPANGTRSIEPMGHVRMMAALQPFISGAISKTVNMPNSATVEDIEKVYMDAWKMGIKAIAIYRDGCKQSQPLNTRAEKAPEAPLAPPPARRTLPKTRTSLTHKFSISGHEGYFTVGLFEDGTPGELFVTMSKQGSTLGGLMDAFATSISLGLQYGVPLAKIVEKFKHTKFEPAGFTGDQDVPSASSIIDYIFKWVELNFLHAPTDVPVTKVTKVVSTNKNVASDAPMCSQCGSATTRAGACYKCNNCGTTTGCG